MPLVALTGDLAEVLDEAGAPLVGPEFVLRAELPGDIRILSMTLTERSNSVPIYLILDGASGRARRLACRSWYFETLAVLDSQTVIAVEHGSQIVRYGPEPGSRTILFPRPR